MKLSIQKGRTLRASDEKAELSASDEKAGLYTKRMVIVYVLYLGHIAYGRGHEGVFGCIVSLKIAV